MSTSPENKVAATGHLALAASAADAADTAMSKMRNAAAESSGEARGLPQPDRPRLHCSNGPLFSVVTPGVSMSRWPTLASILELTLPRNYVRGLSTSCIFPSTHPFE